MNPLILFMLFWFPAIGGDGVGGLEATHAPVVALLTPVGLVVWCPYPATITQHSVVTVPFHAAEMK